MKPDAAGGPDVGHGVRKVTASVDRSVTERDTSAASLVHLDADLLAQLGGDPGDPVELITAWGRRALGRLAAPRPEDTGSGSIRLDRFVRQALKARTNESVEVVLRADLAPARRVVLGAPFDVSRAHNLREHIGETMVVSRTPCMPGGKLFVNLPHSTGGMVFDVLEVDDEPGTFDASTSLEIVGPGSRHAPADHDVTFEDLGGLDHQITLVRELVQLPLQLPFVYRQLGIAAPKGVILYGPPGCGKTHLARAIANELTAHFFFINGPSVVGTMHGETESNLRKIFDEAAHHAPSIIFIDELDSIAPHRRNAGSQSDVRAVTTLLSLMDGLQRVDGLVLIGTTNRVDAVDVALRRPGRFDREVYVGPPDRAGRLAILQIHAREMPLSEPAVDHLTAVAAHAHGFVGADLMELCREAGLTALRRSTRHLTDHLGAFHVEDAGSVQINPEDFDAALRRVRPSAQREIVAILPDTEWTDIGGLASVKHRLRDAVERPLADPAAFAAAGIDPPGGIVLHGPSGTGKSLLVQALARSTKVNFLSVDGPEIFSKWLGESEEAVRHIFDVARQIAPTLLFFDQLDAIVPRRGSAIGSHTAERVVNQLLAELDAARDDPDLIVVGATDRLDLVDEAALRAGRFGTRILVPLPDLDDRTEIVNVHLRGVPLDPSDDGPTLAAEVARQSNGMSGADLREVVQQAKLAAVGENASSDAVMVARRHMEEGLARVRGGEAAPASGLKSAEPR